MQGVGDGVAGETQSDRQRDLAQQLPPPAASTLPPSKRPVVASATSFTAPAVSPVMTARARSRIGTVSARTAWPACRAAASVSPTRPSSGSVKTAVGTTVSIASRTGIPPSALCAATRPW